MRLRYKLNLDTIDVEKLTIELNSFFLNEEISNNITKEQKKLYQSISNCFVGVKSLIKSHPLYTVFIGFYLNHFDKCMREVIGNYGLYTRNEEQITIKLNIDNNNPTLLNSCDCGALSATKKIEEVTNEIKQLLNYLQTMYIKNEVVSYRALQNLPYEENEYVV